MHKVLVINDDKNLHQAFKKILPAPDYQIINARNGNEALITIKKALPDLIILDLQTPGLADLEVLRNLKSSAAKIPVVIFSAQATSDQVISAMKYGAYDYIEKPFDHEKTKSLISEAIKVGHLMRTDVLLELETNEAESADRIVGDSLMIQEVCKLIGRVADSDVSVLLRGESGTGKELVARAIYQNGQRASKPFLAINCAAIPETLLESELFGYEKGAFTGAMKRKMGKFEQVHSGTIFLDEIGDMSMATQAKLLRVLQEGTFERLGGEETIQADVRVIAATNQNLEQAIVEKRFREDLYYRIKVITITLPPLRLRKEDLPELVQYFVAKYSGQIKKQRMTLSPETMEMLMNYDWPGNVRELENTLQRAILLCKGNVITPDVIADDLPLSKYLSEASVTDRLSLFVSDDLERYHGKLYDIVMSELERDLIVAALKKVGGNQVRAAQLLGISRVMLHDRIEKYDIKKEVKIESLSSKV